MRFLFLLLATSVTSFAALHLSTRDLDLLNYTGDPSAGYPTELIEEPDNFNYSAARKVTIVMWDGNTPFGWGDGEVVHVPNYGGFTYNKGKCPVECEWAYDRTRLPSADAVLFDPCLTGPTQYREIPVYMPDKLPGQKWGWFTYEQYHYFPMMKEMDYMDRFDYKMTYHHDAEVQITFACPWAGVDNLLAPVPQKDKSKIVAMFISNCGTGGADIRLAYIKELMKYIQVDSYGHCLHNKDAALRMGGGSHGNTMRDKINIISGYKFMLAFENNMVEDYVTEKLINAYQAGSVPIYMGSPTIDKWQIAPHSLIKTSDYPSPKDLAAYLHYLNEHDEEYMEYFAWKQIGISATFQRLWKNCFAYAECRLCQYVAKSREIDGEYKKPEGFPDRGIIGYALQLNGLDADPSNGDDYVDIPYNPLLDVTEEYTLMAWIKLGMILDGRIIDKNIAGKIIGYNLDVVSAKDHTGHGYLRLCAGGGCYQSKRSLALGIWYHVAATATTTNSVQRFSLYINGKLDSEYTAEEITKKNNLRVRFGRAVDGASSWRPHHAASIFDGVLDEISIWSKPLTQQEIFDYMFLRPSGNEQDLVGWWNFNEGSGNTIHDVGPHGLHGSTVGSPTWLVSLSKPVLDPSNIEGKYE